MSSRNRKSIYIRSMFIGGIVGLLFIFFFFVLYGDLIISGGPTFKIPHNFVVFVSQIAFYLTGDRISPVFIILDMLLFMLYWAILGMGIACGLVWLYLAILQRIGRTNDSYSNS